MDYRSSSFRAGPYLDSSHPAASWRSWPTMLL